MHKRALAISALLLSMVSVLQLSTFSAADGAQQGSGTGVSSDAIQVGITGVDTAAIKAYINLNEGNGPDAYKALIDHINAEGGINGRKIKADYIPVNPIGTAPAAAVCTQLTEDDHAFIVLGFFQAADTACYVTQHATPIIGASLTAAATAAAKAPAYNTQLSDTDLIPKEMAAFKSEGIFAGKRVGVVGSTVDTTEMNQVIPILHKLKVKVVQTATSSAPSSDSTTLTSEYNVIANKFHQSGVNLVVAVGNAGEQFPGALQGNQSTYLPRILVTDQQDFEAYTNSASSNPSIYLKNGLTAGSIPPLTMAWEANGMQKCIDVIRKAYPKDQIGDPLTATPSEQTTDATWGNPELACQQITLLSDLLKAAGKTVNNTTLAKGADTLTHVVIPGYAGTFNFSHGNNDGDSPAFLFEWNAAKNQMVLTKTVP